jgi:hypothetical protein
LVAIGELQSDETVEVVATVLAGDPELAVLKSDEARSLLRRLVVHLESKNFGRQTPGRAAPGDQQEEAESSRAGVPSKCNYGPGSTHCLHFYRGTKACCFCTAKPPGVASQ